MTLIPFEYLENGEAYFRQLCHLEGCVWLDSGTERTHGARYEFLTALPRETYTQIAGGTAITLQDGQVMTSPVPLLRCVEQRMKECTDKGPADLPFTGGVIGYLGYESLHPAFGLSAARADEPATAHFGLYDWVLLQDHAERKSVLCHWNDCCTRSLELVLNALEAEPRQPGSFECAGLTADSSEAEYLAAVETIKNHIRAGDCYQVNYSQRFSGDFSGSPSACYLHLRGALPGPFSGYLATPAGSVMSFSPERFLSVDERDVMTQPIKGTMPRSADPSLDVQLASELTLSDKNRAENVMIVDLLRNDLSKVCEPFSVKVPELFRLQSFRNVHHLVSTVTGRLSSHKTVFDLIDGSFPGGSITGAPKKRAMEIIQGLEKHSRSVYCGSIIYVSANGRMDSNIAIRTLMQVKDKLFCWGGGGIVVDSDPQLEYQESLQKVRLLLDALRGSGNKDDL